MSVDRRHPHMDAARVRAELSVQDLWLRYLALGGTQDAFEVDGYLQGLVPLDTFQQDVLAQALNEALLDHYRADRVPLSVAAPEAVSDEERLRDLALRLLRGRPSTTAAPRPDDDEPRP